MSRAGHGPIPFDPTARNLLLTRDFRAGSYNAPGVEGARLLAEGLRHVTALTILELW